MEDRLTLPVNPLQASFYLCLLGEHLKALFVVPKFLTIDEVTTKSLSEII